MQHIHFALALNIYTFLVNFLIDAVNPEYLFIGTIRFISSCSHYISTGAEVKERNSYPF